MLVTAWLIRRNIPHDDTLSDELNEGFTTENPEKYWLKYEVGGFPKPVRWQGWLCMVVLFSSPFVVIIFTRRRNSNGYCTHNYNGDYGSNHVKK